VVDLLDNNSVPFEYVNGGVWIKGVRFQPYDVKVFAVRRGTLVAALPAWWSEKTTYWKRAPAQPAAAAASRPEPRVNLAENVIPFERWRFKTDPDRAMARGNQWLAPQFNDAAWPVKTAGPWNYFDPDLKDYHGTGLYRARFTIPPEWNGRRIVLNLFSNDTPIVYDTGVFYLNGKKITTYKAHGWTQTYNFDVTDLVHQGENILALEAVAGAQLGGLGTGAVWIESRAPLQPALSLAGTWQATRGDYLTQAAAVVPGSPVTGKFMSRSVRIPADWKGRSVFVDWSSQKQWVGSVVVNGIPIHNSPPRHPFGLLARVNVTPYLKPGEDNVIEVWLHRAITWSGGTENEELNELQLDSFKIGCGQ
jgi:hypothetical protein